MMRIFVDRDTALSCLKRLIREGLVPRQLAIVCANTGMGKTALLEELYDRYNGQNCVAYIDVGRTYELVPLLNDIAAQLEGQGVRLSKYRDLASSLALEQPVSVQLSNVQASNSPIDIAIDATRRSREVADLLLGQLLADIEANSASRCLVLIDRYELAEAPLQNWFITSLIPGILHRKSAICVLAGCTEPTLTFAEGQNVERLSLPELQTGHISQWLVAAGVPQPTEYVEFLWEGTKGVPGSIQPFIINLLDSQKDRSNG
jgi:hypothetical protein